MDQGAAGCWAWRGAGLRAVGESLPGVQPWVGDAPHDEAGGHCLGTGHVPAHTHAIRGPLFVRTITQTNVPLFPNWSRTVLELLMER